MRVRFHETRQLDEASVEKAMNSAREVEYELARIIEGLERLDEQTQNTLEILFCDCSFVDSVEDLKNIKSDIGLLELNIGDFLEKLREKM